MKLLPKKVMPQLKIERAYFWRWWKPSSHIWVSALFIEGHTHIPAYGWCSGTTPERAASTVLRFFFEDYSFEQR